MQSGHLDLQANFCLNLCQNISKCNLRAFNDQQVAYPM
jgi:hypothetical protein